MNLCAAATKLSGLEDDEVFVEGLQGGVRDASGAVEDGAAEEDPGVFERDAG